MSLNATFWTFVPFNQYLAAIPFTSNAVATGPYLWADAGLGSEFQRPLASPGCRVGAAVAQFLFLGDLYQQQQQTLFTGNGSTATYSGFLATPMGQNISIADQQATFAGLFGLDGQLIEAVGTLTGGTINYATGALSLTWSTAPATGDLVFASYTQQAPYRCAWSAIGDPTTWPTPLTNAALAVQSGINDLDAQQGQVMFIAGYPLYGLIFQTFGITRASYIGGNVVFSWQPYEFKRGCIAHGAAIKVGPLVYFLADDGFYVTDGANVTPIGTASDNSSGIDNWFWQSVNPLALEAIRAGYDATKRSIFFAIPTGTNTLPDTLLVFNVIAQRWTRSQIPVETIYTADNGIDGTPATKQRLGIIDQAHTPGNLTGPLLTGYAESCDMYFVDGMRRFISGVRPHANCGDNPLVTVGSRKSLTDAVSYSASSSPDQFSRIAPVMASGIYNRVRVQSAAFTSAHGASLLIEQGGSV